MNRLTVIVFLFFWAAVLPAQEYGLYQMRDVWNSTHLNPGFFPRQQFILSLPSVHTSLNSIGINKEHLFEYNSAENTNYLNLDGILGSLERDLVVKNSTVVDGLGIGGRVGKFFVSLSTSSVLDAEFTLPEALLRTVWEGTEKYLGKPLNIGPTGNMIAYQKIGLGVNYEVNPRLSVGARVNRLLGGASLVTERSNLTLTQSKDIYQTTAEIDYQAFYYGAGQFNLLDQTIEGFENFGDALDDEGVPPEGGSGLRQYTNGNNGWSVDLGAEYLFGDRLTLSASLLNLGSIRWEKATQQIDLTGTVNFEGVDAANLDEDEDFEVIPGLDTIGTFEANSNVAYTQALAPRTYLGANYQVLPFLDVGGLLYNEFFSGGTFTAFSLSSRVSLGRIFSLGAIYTLQNGTFNSFGANTALKLGPVQLYAIADNLSAVLNEERLDGTNFRAGLNLTFGRKKSELRIAAARGLDTPMPEAAQLPSAPVPTGDETTGTQPNGATVEEGVADNTVPASDEPAAVPNPSRSEHQPTNTETDELLVTTDTETQAEPLPSASENNTTDYPPNHPANAEGLKLFSFKLELRDKEDLGLVEDATVNVYRIEEGGYFKLIRTEEAFGGRINLQLTAEKTPYQAVVNSSKHDELIVDFQPARKSSLDQVVFLRVKGDAVQEAPESASPEATSPPEVEELAPESLEEDIFEVTESEEAAPSSKPEPPPVTLAPEPTASPAPPEEVARPEEATTVPAPTADEQQSTTRLQPPYETYLLTKRTSLREQPNAQSRVISRMSVDTELKLLERTNQWWWRVSMGGWEGYVKAALLKLRE